jgi:radical SAM superfamily enzyme YgiQ (UPF0313 family)
MHIYNFEPLGLYYLAAGVKNDHDVAMVDLNNELLLSEELPGSDPFIEAIESFNPRIVAFSALMAVRTHKIKELCKQAKQVNSEIVTVVGGVHASLWPSDFEDESVDIVITKDNVETFSGVIRSVEEGRSIEEINRLIASNKAPRGVVQLARWSLPYREIGRKYKGSYRIAIGKPGHSQISERIASVKTSSGCPFRCNFCCLWQLYPKYETGDLDRIVEDISSLEEDHVFFADDESLINVDYMLELAAALIESGVKKKYIMYGRSDTILKNPNLIEKLAEAGLKQIWIGIEGSTNDQLDEYNKRNTTESHAQAFNICRRNGVDVHSSALVNPNFRKQDFEYMLKYTKEILELASCHFFVLTPLKGTELYDERTRLTPGDFLTNDSDHFSIRQSVLRPEHMTIEEFHQEYANLQRDFNSDTIPFRMETSDYDPAFIPEYEHFIRRNVRLYENIVNAHQGYDQDWKYPEKEIMGSGSIGSCENLLAAS